MTAHLHHVHIFASDIDKSVAWWATMLGGAVAYDGDFGNARNVFMRVGQGRLHLYDQKPRALERNAIHHVGIRSDNLAGLVAHMQAHGQIFRTAIREFGAWRYIMSAAPDAVVLELFQIDTDQMPPALRDYFADETR